MRFPLVSVIMPIYHQGENLNVSIPCVLNQTYSNIELIAVNDGSTKEDRLILEEYKKRDDRIRIIDKDNGGLVDATSVGVDNAVGEYICFVDPDDEIGSDYISMYVDRIEDCDFVSTGFFFKSGEKISAYKLHEDRVFDKQDLADIMPVFLSESPYFGISNRVFISRWNKLYRTDLLRKVVKEYRDFKDITLGEDTFFTFFVLKYSSKGKTVIEPNSYYYHINNSNSMMNNLSFDRHIKQSELAFRRLSSVLKKNNYSSGQAYALFYNEVNSLRNRLPGNSKRSRYELEIRLFRNFIYNECIRRINKEKKIKKWVRVVYYRSVPLNLHICIRKFQRKCKNK